MECNCQHSVHIPRTALLEYHNSQLLISYFTSYYYPSINHLLTSYQSTLVFQSAQKCKVKKSLSTESTHKLASTQTERSQKKGFLDVPGNHQLWSPASGSIGLTLGLQSRSVRFTDHDCRALQESVKQCHLFGKPSSWLRVSQHSQDCDFFV